MAFLLKSDYFSSITTGVLDALTGGDDNIITELSAEAVEEMKSYLNTRYLTATIFAASGTDRNKTLVMYCKDIALFHIYAVYSLTVIPVNRVNRYNNALNWLCDVRDQKINVDGLPINTNPLGVMIKTGTNPKRENHQL